MSDEPSASEEVPVEQQEAVIFPDPIDVRAEVLSSGRSYTKSIFIVIMSWKPQSKESTARPASIAMSQAGPLRPRPVKRARWRLWFIPEPR